MKAIIVEQNTGIFSQPDASSAILKEAPAGEEVEVGAASKNNGREWHEVRTGDGSKGYIPGDTKIVVVRPAKLLQKIVPIHADAEERAQVVGEIRKGEGFELRNTVQGSSGQWVAVRTNSGTVGYIPGSTRVQTTPAKGAATKKDPSHDMLVGGLWCVGGIIVTAATYNAASQGGGGHYFVAWGAILFGGFQFLKGLFGLMTT